MARATRQYDDKKIIRSLESRVGPLGELDGIFTQIDYDLPTQQGGGGATFKIEVTVRVSRSVADDILDEAR